MDRTGHFLRRAALSATVLLCMTAATATQAAKADSVAQITQVERQLERIYNSPGFAKDPTIALKYFDTGPDMRLFDIMLPGDFRGDEFRKHFIEVGQQFQGKVEFNDLEVKADPKIGFASMKQHFAGKDREGKPFDMVMRVTDSFQKSDGGWKIVAEHVSLALDTPTFMNLIKAKP